MQSLASSLRKTLRRPRGFVIFVVLVLLVAITAIVVGQMDAASNELVVGQQSENDVRARGAAEACLALMTRYAEVYMDTPAALSPPGCGISTAVGPCQPDFDALLDKDNSRSETSGDYLPSGIAGMVAGTVRPLGGSTPASDYRLIDLGNNTGCFIRLDDNSDDAVPTAGLPLGSTDAAGPESDAARLLNNFRDVNFLDRDRAIVITAIGITPLPALDATAYTRAQARVTLKRLLAVSNPATVGSSGVVANDIEINNNAQVCGVGGMTADTIDVGSNGCFCGLVTADNFNPSTAAITTVGCGACPSCNATQVIDSGGPPPVPPVEIPPWSNKFMHAEGWGRPVDYDTPTPDPGSLTDGGESKFDNATGGTPTANVGPNDKTICSFRGKSVTGDGHLFVWDPYDTDAFTTLSAKGWVNIDVNADAIFEVAPFPVHNCTSNAEAFPAGIVPDACSWNPGTNTITCAAGQSPCWKLIGILNGTGAQNVDPTPRAEHTNTAGDEGFAPKAAVAGNEIPNVVGNKFWAQAVGTANHLCGRQNGFNGVPYCANCNGTTHLVDYNGDHWHFENGGGEASLTTTLPGPAVMALTSDPNKRIHLKSGGTAAQPLHMTILSDQRIEYGKITICGARLRCEPGKVTGAIDLSEAKAVAWVGGPGAGCCSPGGVDDQKILGYAIKSTNLCEVKDAATMYGSMRCGTIRVNNNLKMIGDLGAFRNEAPAGGTHTGLGGSGSCSDVHLEFNNTPVMIGDIGVVGDVEFNNNGNMTGRIYVDGSVCGNNNFTLNGAIMTTGTFEMNNNLQIVVDPNMTVGNTSTFFSPGATSYMEAPW